MKTLKQVEAIDCICEEQYKDLVITEAEYQGKTVKLNDPIRGGSKKFLYRTFRPDYLVAVDVKMILEINKSMYQHKNQVWTNYNKSYEGLQHFDYFQPGKGWSSGPTALWLSAQHRHKTIYILGFDYKGLKDGMKFNNLYADTPNYKKSQDSATFFGNWLRQTTSVVKEHEKTEFVRVIAPDNYCPEELNKLENYNTITVQEFKNRFVLA